MIPDILTLTNLRKNRNKQIVSKLKLVKYGFESVVAI